MWLQCCRVDVMRADVSHVHVESSDPLPEETPLIWVERKYRSGKYLGQFDSVRVVRHGQGRFVYDHPPGSSYNGNWVDDQVEGVGVFKDVESMFSGQWKQSQKHGHGEERWFEDASVYRGSFVAGEKHGMGRYEWGSGSWYEGGFEHDQISGQGKYVEDDSIYEGQFKNDLRHGEGTYTTIDGCAYAGEWQNGEKHGSGSLKWGDGRILTGLWHRGEQHGRGVFSARTGSLENLCWVMGKRVTEEELEKAFSEKALSLLADGDLAPEKIPSLLHPTPHYRFSTTVGKYLQDDINMQIVDEKGINGDLAPEKIPPLLHPTPHDQFSATIGQDLQEDKDKIKMQIVDEKGETENVDEADVISILI